MEYEFKKLCKKYGISAFILFGSQAVGRMNKMSDMDIAYLPTRKISPSRENVLFLDVLKIVRRDDIDLVDLAKADLLLKYSVVNLGKVIVCDDQKALYNFIVKTRSEYLDTQYIRQIFIHYLKKRIRTGRFGG